MPPEEFEGIAPLESQPFAVLESKPESVVFWGWTDLLLVLGLLSALCFVILLGFSAYTYFRPDLKGDSLAFALPLQFLFYAAEYLCLLMLFKLKYERPVFSSLGWKRTNTNLVAAGAGGILLSFGISAVAYLIDTPQVETPMEKLGDTPFSMTLLAITAVVLAPLFEELLFRGFLQPLVSKTFGTIAGVLTTAILFGGLHAFEYMKVWQYVAAITTVGLVLGTLRARTGSLIPGVVLHGCFNAVSIVVLIKTKYFTHT